MTASDHAPDCEHHRRGICTCKPVPPTASPTVCAVCGEDATGYACGMPVIPRPAPVGADQAGEGMSGELVAQVSAALYGHNSPVIELPDDEYDCCADVAIKTVLASDWLAAHDAQVRAEALREAAGEAERHAMHCPEGCDSLRCRNDNLTTANWLRDRAARVRGGDGGGAGG